MVCWGCFERCVGDVLNGVLGDVLNGVLGDVLNGVLGMF